MSVRFYLFLGLVYILTVSFFGVYMYRRDRLEALRRRSVALHRNQQRSYNTETIYKFMLRFPLTRGYIGKISRRYELLYPGKPSDIARKTMSLTGIAFLSGLSVIVFIYMLRPGTQHFILTVYIIFVLNNEIINYSVNSAEIRLRMDQERFISNVGRNFFCNFYIDDAILGAMDSPMSKEMRVHAQALYDITISNNMREEVERYNATSHDKFMKMLLALCVNVVERSNGSEEENNMLAANLINLKKEINLDYLKMKKLQFVFSGSIFAAVVVCLPLTAIQEFGLYISPELITFYKGLLGILYIGLIYLCSVIVYLLTNSAKEIKRPVVRNYWLLERIERNRLVKLALDNFNEKHQSRMLLLKDTLKRLGESITPNQLLLQSSLTALSALMLSIIFVFVMHSNSKALLMENAEDTRALSSAATEEQLSMVKETILYYSNKYKGEVLTRDELKLELSRENNVQNEALKEKIADEVITRNEKYRNEYFKYYELLVCTGIAIAAFWTPYLLILYKKKLMQGVMEDEVVQFNSIIYMMMYSDYITVADILEQMEIFAVVFKTTIRECLNEFNSGDLEALERMRERETCDSFRHLTANLIRCDEMPISKAFHEIAADRENYFERRKQEDEFSIQRKADSIKPLAFLPGILVMIYLILPVVIMSLKALQDVLTLLKEAGMY